MADDTAPPAAAVADLAEPAQVRHPQVACDGVLAGHLDAPLAHAVDVRRQEAGVLERQPRRLERGHLLRAADVLGERQLTDANDGGLVAQRHRADVAGSDPAAPAEAGRSDATSFCLTVAASRG